LKKFLTNEIMHDTLSYGYILEGPRFYGKQFIAESIAKEITSQSYITIVLPTEDRKLLSVDDIRAVKEDAYSQSFGGQKKVYIIPNADDMSNSAQNAFLKVLEEPPQDCVFFILVQNRYNVLSTIRSRCTILALERYKDFEIAEYLKSQGIEYSPEIIKLCDGALTKYPILLSKDYKEMEALAYKILLHIRELHPARIFAIFKHIQKMKESVNDILDIFLMWYRDLYVFKQTGQENCIDNKSRTAELIKDSKNYHVDEILKIIDGINFAKSKIEYNGNLEITINSLLMLMKGGI
jgi:DNA polymerase-3 subunit delta'